MANIELYSKLNEPIEAIDRIGELFAKSGMFGCDKVEQGKILALACVVENKSPIQILREYHLIDGRLCDRADSMLAKFRGRGGKYRIIARTADEARIEMLFEAQKLEFGLTWKEVQAEPFVLRNDGKGYKKNWATPRARMQTMWARVVSDAVRALCPEIVAGVSTPEEIQDEAAGSEVLAKPLFAEKERKAAKTVPMEVVAPAPETPPEASPPVSADPSPKSPAPEAPPPAPTRFVAQALSNGRLTPETVAKLEEVITPELGEPTLRWMEKNKWIPPTGSLSELSVKRAQLILDKPEGLVLRLKEGGLL